jgi:uncharacterized RDD family membrane protein YckC
MAMLYELLLALAIAFVAGLIFSVSAGGTVSGTVRYAFQFYLFAVLGAYFVWCWRHGGQTLPMKTWHLRLLSADGTPVSTGRATLRYLLAWPSLACAGGGILWALYDRERQFLHDRLAGTKIIRIEDTAT